MTRNLKALGLALVAVLAMSAVVASSASANRFGFTSDGTPTGLTGEQDGNTGSATATQIFDRGSRSSALDCTAVTLKGTQTGLAAPSITLEAEYPTGHCHSSFASNIHNDFVTDKCGYVFTNTAKDTATASVECTNPGGVIRVTPTAFGSSVCTITVPPQNVGGHVILHNIDNGDVTATATIENITSTRHGSSLCGNHHETDGTYTGNAIIRGFEDVNGVHGGATNISSS